MKRLCTLFLFLICLSLPLKAQSNLLTKFELSFGQETVTYEEGIAYFELLDRSFEIIQLQSYGSSDIGKPIHLAVLSLEKDFDPQSLQRKNKTILLINNAIHPGEPDGVDASMLLLRDLATNKDLQKLLENTVIAVIPFYNVDGVINRNSTSRVNQKGPNEYGFRGNAKNLDLNRDFIKADSENAKTFAQIFQFWQPDVYIENHVTNGADYQHVVTYLATQADKLGGVLGNYLRGSLVPQMEQKMTAGNFEMCPYVNLFGQSPDKGYQGFVDSPRYSSGYAALFHTLAFIVETHMLKNFKNRVEGTYAFMLSMLECLEKEGSQIKALRKASFENAIKQSSFPIQWEINKEKFEEITFKGYEASEISSKVTTGKRLFYDRNKPFTRKISFYNLAEVKLSVEKPLAYLIPKAWKEVIERLKMNGVSLQQLNKDAKIPVQAYYIENFKSVENPYEGHYLHFGVQLRKEKQEIQFYKGDYIIYLNQPNNRFVVETLEPQAPDSYFNWNFFDSILQQKEWYSDYVFEEIAEDLLLHNRDLKAKFESKKQAEPAFAQDAGWQLFFIYQNSPYYEKSHRRYPVYRLEENIKLD